MNSIQIELYCAGAGLRLEHGLLECEAIADALGLRPVSNCTLDDNDTLKPIQRLREAADCFKAGAQEDHSITIYSSDDVSDPWYLQCWHSSGHNVTAIRWTLIVRMDSDWNYLSDLTFNLFDVCGGDVLTIANKRQKLNAAIVDPGLRTVLFSDDLGLMSHTFSGIPIAYQCLPGLELGLYWLTVLSWSALDSLKADYVDRFTDSLYVKRLPRGIAIRFGESPSEEIGAPRSDYVRIAKLLGVQK